jgi:hypothetical protein
VTISMARALSYLASREIVLQPMYTQLEDGTWALGLRMFARIEKSELQKPEPLTLPGDGDLTMGDC